MKQPVDDTCMIGWKGIIKVHLIEVCTTNYFQIFFQLFFLCAVDRYQTKIE